MGVRAWYRSAANPTWSVLEHSDMCPSFPISPLLYSEHVVSPTHVAHANTCIQRMGPPHTACSAWQHLRKFFIYCITALEAGTASPEYSVSLTLHPMYTDDQMAINAMISIFDFSRRNKYCNEQMANADTSNITCNEHNLNNNRLTTKGAQHRTKWVHSKDRMVPADTASITCPKWQVCSWHHGTPAQYGYLCKAQIRTTTRTPSSRSFRNCNIDFKLSMAGIVIRPANCKAAAVSFNLDTQPLPYEASQTLKRACIDNQLKTMHA